MFFRVRTTLADRPGALAVLAERCGEAGVNILGLQLFPQLGAVTDELIVNVPAGWTAQTITELVSGAGGNEVSVEPCTTHDLLDQATRWLQGAADVVRDPSSLDRVLDDLAGAEPEEWSATEVVRAEALKDIASASLSAPESTPSQVAYATEGSVVKARIGSWSVGRAEICPDHNLYLEVAPAWRRLGIGTELLKRSARLAVAQGEASMTVVGLGDDAGLLPTINAAGLHGMIKMADGLLLARVSLTGIRPDPGGSGSQAAVGPDKLQHDLGSS